MDPVAVGLAREQIVRCDVLGAPVERGGKPVAARREREPEEEIVERRDRPLPEQRLVTDGGALGSKGRFEGGSAVLPHAERETDGASDASAVDPHALDRARRTAGLRGRLDRERVVDA